MNKYVAILHQGEISIHLPDFSGGYATLCGMDNDSHKSVDQEMVDVPNSRKVDCVTCFNIWSVSQKFTINDFSGHSI
jgi:hypothetical protein